MFVEKERINTQKYKSSIPCYNVDSTQNKVVTIVEFVKIELDIRNYLESIYLVAVELEKCELILDI